MSHSAKLMVLLLVLLPTALAQGSQGWYRVEIILFRQWSDSDSERYPTNPPLPAYQRLTVLQSSGRAFQRLRGSELRLQGARDRLEASPDYEILAHFGWQQPGLSEEEAISVALPLDWQPSAMTFDAQRSEVGVPVIVSEPDNPGSSDRETDDTDDNQTSDSGPADMDVDDRRQDNVFAKLGADTPLLGTLTLTRSRYLHLNAHIHYRVNVFQPSWSDREGDGGSPVYVMDQSRRMRSNELHYLDHPTLGILVKVTPM